MNRVFSGIQPTGNLHLGNYLGAVRNWVGMQATFECIYCIVDLHAITLPHDPRNLAAATRDMAAGILAAGVDPTRTILFHQSAVTAHAELAWVLMSVARTGWLDRMIQFKEKRGKDSEGPSVGLYTYPVLQAADILAYRATHVPVGDDQKQHLELARDIAIKFNAMYGEGLLVPPQPVIGGTNNVGAARIMSLRDGTAKMSKSDASAASRIDLTDDADTIAAKIKRAKSDAPVLPDDPTGLVDRPEARNLVGIYAALAGTSVAAVLAEWGGKGFGAFKPALAEVTVAALAPINAEYVRLRADPGHLDAVLRDGAARAGQIAAPLLREVYDAVGFLR